MFTINKTNEKKNLSSIQSNMKQKVVFFIKGRCLMNSLHILYGQFLGILLLICTLNYSRDLDFFISVGTLSYRFGPIQEAISMPYLSVHGVLWLHLD